MNILEELREKKMEYWDSRPEHITIDNETDLLSLLSLYDMALENTLLKLKNRGVEITDLKHRIAELERKFSRFNVLCAGCNSLKEVNR